MQKAVAAGTQWGASAKSCASEDPPVLLSSKGDLNWSPQGEDPPCPAQLWVTPRAQGQTGSLCVSTAESLDAEPAPFLCPGLETAPKAERC